MYNRTSLKNIAGFLMGVKGNRFEKPHHSFYKQFSSYGILDNRHVAYAVADVLFTLWAYTQKMQQNMMSISETATSTVT